MALIRRKKKEQDDTPAAVQDLFDRQHRTRIDENFRNARQRLVFMGMTCAAILMIAAYFFMPSSRIRGISVSGTDYLSEKYVREAAAVSEKGLYYLTMPFIVERRLDDDPFISSSKVTLENGNMIHIDITEKQPAGYRYTEKPEILFTDGSKAELKSSYLDIIARIPMISGFMDDEQTRLLMKAFSSVDRNVIEDMSEVSQFSLSFDDQAIKVLMRNGGYFIGNYFNLYKIQYYNGIYSELRDKSMCIFAGDNNATAFSHACPWVDETEGAELWLDENGEPLLNENGDKIIRHYYRLSDGSFALDAEGNKIVVPINEQGYEVRDKQFKEHYDSGYYSSGELVIPDDSARHEVPEKENA